MPRPCRAAALWSKQSRFFAAAPIEACRSRAPSRRAILYCQRTVFDRNVISCHAAEIRGEIASVTVPPHRRPPKKCLATPKCMPTSNPRLRRRRRGSRHANNQRANNQRANNQRANNQREVAPDDQTLFAAAHHHIRVCPRSGGDTDEHPRAHASQDAELPWSRPALCA